MLQSFTNGILLLLTQRLIPIQIVAAIIIRYIHLIEITRYVCCLNHTFIEILLLALCKSLASPNTLVVCKEGFISRISLQKLLSIRFQITIRIIFQHSIVLSYLL